MNNIEKCKFVFEYQAMKKMKDNFFNTTMVTDLELNTLKSFFREFFEKDMKKS